VLTFYNFGNVAAQVTGGLIGASHLALGGGIARRLPGYIPAFRR